jgi:hypothetical protein
MKINLKISTVTAVWLAIVISLIYGIYGFLIFWEIIF